MPRFLVETTAAPPAGDGAAARLSAARFPELEIEHRYAARDAAGGRWVWVCRAPSEGHVTRWATALGLPVGSVRRIDADYPTISGSSNSSRLQG